jgi:hypothetical protein
VGGTSGGGPKTTEAMGGLVHEIQVPSTSKKEGGSHTVNTPRVRNNGCWRCGDPSHFRRECQVPPKTPENQGKNPLNA